MPIGRIAGPFGVRGELKVDLLTDFPERFERIDEVFIGAQRTPQRVESSRKHKNQVVLKLRGVDTPEAVKMISGEELSVPRDEAVALAEDEYYLDDLLGVSVETDTGKPIGVVRDVLRTGSNDVYVVRAGDVEVLVPGTSEAVRELDVPGRRMVIESWILASEEDTS